ncbi:hypothetical protein BYT27DRAFT_7250361 [Phlegmacium glaucopus]|nr:hypothetical protein BYT27DRAFT_7250361 [Phlegmacium glaucopus]
MKFKALTEIVDDWRLSQVALGFIAPHIPASESIFNNQPLTMTFMTELATKSSNAFWLTATVLDPTLSAALL